MVLILGFTRKWEVRLDERKCEFIKANRSMRLCLYMRFCHMWTYVCICTYVCVQWTSISTFCPYVIFRCVVFLIVRHSSLTSPPNQLTHSLTYSLTNVTLPMSHHPSPMVGFASTGPLDPSDLLPNVKDIMLKILFWPCQYSEEQEQTQSICKGWRKKISIGKS